MNRHPFAVACIVALVSLPELVVGQQPQGAGIQASTGPRADPADTTRLRIVWDSTRPLIGAPDRTLRDSIRVRVLTAESTRVSQQTCGRARVKFAPLLGGTAGPPTAPAVWSQLDSGCTAVAMWRLSAELGSQFLQAMAVRASNEAVPRSDPLLIPALAKGPSADRDLRVERADTGTLRGPADRTLADSIRVRVLPADTRQQHTDSLTCVGVNVQFTPLNGGAATPQVAPTVWDSRQLECTASARWHVSAETGRQFLEAVAVQPGAVVLPRSDPYRLYAEAVTPPRDLAVTVIARRNWGFVNGTELLEARVVPRDPSQTLDRARCDSLWVRFTPYASGLGTGGAVGVNPAQTMWQTGPSRRGHDRRTGHPADASATRGSCGASLTWRLSDEPGEQFLEAVVVQGNSVTGAPRSEVTRRPIVARKGMSLVFGLAATASRTLYDSLTVWDSVYVNAPHRSHVTPAFGAEFPVPWLGPLRPVLGRFADRVRLMVAVSARDPSREWYLGLSLNTLLGRHYEGDILRFAAGVRMQHITVMRSTSVCVRTTVTDTTTMTESICPEQHKPMAFFVSVALDGSGIVESVMGGFGLKK